MSALPPKADIGDAMRNVRFVPKADITGLFDYFVGKLLQKRRHGEVERLSGLKIDQQLELAWPLNGQVAWICTRENSTYVTSRLLMH